MNTIGYFEIQSSNLPKAIEFYQTLFGWRFIKETFVPIDYYRIETDTISGGLLPRPVSAPSMRGGTNAFVCSVQVADFDAVSAQLLELGGQVAMAKFAVPGRCWQGYFLDLDDNTIGLFQVDEKAV